ncbi:amino acid transporter [Streptomyces sp. BE147]|uniref:nucleotidyltransferase domain-containing protein n=1 Tax=unclassified Streptomyces TaxID=2593676 RepID=UPI002E75DD65|nr:amino acid transporter [Streptomyces sp. BE147]MEE1737945.1 amino acid transporter [Streptomyces sp. BE147]
MSIMMSAEDVLDILDLLGGAGVDVWLDGGWGVDALLGRQTRAHDDLDIVVRHSDRDRCTEVMANASFTLWHDGGPFNWVLSDTADRRVDVHLVDLSTTLLDERGEPVHGPNGLAHPVGSLDGTGTVLGRTVACVTAEFQVHSHTGYAIDDNDIRDVLALHRRFGMPLPPPYADLAARA